MVHTDLHHIYTSIKFKYKYCNETLRRNRFRYNYRYINTYPLTVRLEVLLEKVFSRLYLLSKINSSFVLYMLYNIYQKFYSSNVLKHLLDT